MLPIYINASVLHKLQFNRRATKLLYNKRAELSLVKRWAIGDTGKFKKEVNLWQKVKIPSVDGVSLPSAPKVTRKKGK